MTPKKPPIPTLLGLILLFIVGSLAMMPQVQFFAQSCNTGEQTHVVSSGENLYRIGLRYGVSFTAIAQRNGISNVNRIDAGSVLCIPAGGTTSTTNTTTIITQVIVVTATPSAETTTDTSTTQTVAAGEENWCYTGGPWDDGRCIHPNDTFLQDYWFYAGWCNAQVELGNYGGTLDQCLSGAGGSNVDTVVTTFNYALVDGDDGFACTIIYDRDTGSVTALAEWEDPYTDQDQVIFFTNLPDFANHAANLGEDDTQAGLTTLTLPHKTFSQASAHLKTVDDKGNRESVEIATCDRIET